MDESDFDSVGCDQFFRDEIKPGAVDSKSGGRGGGGGGGGAGVSKSDGGSFKQKTLSFLKALRPKTKSLSDIGITPKNYQHLSLNDAAYK